MSAPWLIETARLRLRELGPDDAAAMFELNADPDVLRFTGDPPFASVEAARAFLIAYPDYRLHGMGRWLVERREDAAPLGWCGLKRHKSGEVDLGYRFLRRYWGQGYATEAARACLRFGFESLGLERIVAHAMLENGASIRVMQKCGMQYLRDDTCADAPSAVYQITSGAPG